MPTVVEEQSLNRWTASEVLVHLTVKTRRSTFILFAHPPTGGCCLSVSFVADKATMNIGTYLSVYRVSQGYRSKS